MAEMKAPTETSTQKVITATPQEQKPTSQEYFEMYYDAEHKVPYFYNPKTGASVWELPPGALCADMTGGNMQQLNHDVLQDEIHEEMTDAKKKLIEIEELK